MTVAAIIAGQLPIMSRLYGMCHSLRLRSVLKPEVRQYGDHPELAPHIC